MLRRLHHKSIRFSAAAIYLAALLVSGFAHDHQHAGDDQGHQQCAHQAAHAGHDHHCDHHDEHAPAPTFETADATRPDISLEGECQICEFLGRPLIAAEPFVLAVVFEQVALLSSLPPAEAPAAVILTAQARAPPPAA